MTVCLSSISAETIEDFIKLYNEGKIEQEQIIETTLNLLKDDPDNAKYNLILGAIYTDTFQFKKAIPYLKKISLNNVNNEEKLLFKAETLRYLGSCYYYLGNYTQSKAHLVESIELNAREDLTDKSLDLMELYGFNELFENGPIIESEHFIFHFQHSTKVQNMESYVQKREEAFRKINQFFKSKIPTKMNYYIYNSNVNIFSIPIGFAMRKQGIIHALYNQSVGHEMTHVISYYYDKFIKKAGLIEEGMAVHFNQTNQNKMQLAKNRFKQNGIKHISIIELWNNWTENPLTYSIAGAFVKYLIDHEGEEKFKLIIANQSYQNAKYVYGDNLDVLINNIEEELLNY